ncbi:MAG: hypothetical protein MUC97_18665 [Bernardetiaceae bacterium]|jgi:hypothetical protein|nr:hypothetical protein [Bernardetiaceae bacterium]
MPKLEDPLKKAILAMPEPEKDKLLLKLVAKDEMLVAKLHHQLLEDDSDTEQQRQTLLDEIEKMASYEYFDTPGWLMMAMRDFNGYITRHVKITKDKHGEVLLTIALVNRPFSKHRPMLDKHAGRAETFAEYVVKKADFVMKKLAKIHPDYYVEFEDEVNEMLEHLHSYKPCLPWLREFPLPKKFSY